MFLLHLAERGHGPDAHDARIYANRNEGHYARERLEIALLDKVFASKNDGGCAIGDAGRISSSNGPCFGKHGHELRELFHGCADKGMLVAGKNLWAFFAFEGDRRELGGEAVARQRRGCSSLRRQGEFVLFLARDFILLGENFGSFTHQKLRYGTEETVAIHAVHDFLITEAISPTSAIQIKGQARHGFGASGEDTIEATVGDFREAEGDGF